MAGARGRAVGLIFEQENFGHFAPAGLGGTGEASRPPWYLVARIIGGSMPLIMLLPAAIVALWARVRVAQRLAGSLMSVSGAVTAHTRPLLYQGGGLTLAVVALFSLASAKRDDYILPALPGIAILCASAFSFAWARPIVRLLNVAIAAIAVAMPLGIVLAVAMANTSLAAALRLQSSDAGYLELFLDAYRSLRLWSVLFTLVVLVASVAALREVRRRRVFVAGFAIAVLNLAGSVLFCAVLRPELAQARTLKYFAAAIHSRIGAGQLGVARDYNFEPSFYYGAPVKPLVSRNGLATPRSGAPLYLMAYESEIQALAPYDRARLSLVMKSERAGRLGAAELTGSSAERDQPPVSRAPGCSPIATGAL